MLRILVVEDDEATRSSLAQALSEEGYSVVTAADGHEALVMLQRPELPDLLLLDLVMPPPDGYEVARIVAEVPRYADLPIMVLSAASPTPEDAAFRFPILRKPVALDTLIAAIQTVSSWATEAPTDRDSIVPLVADDERSRTK